MSDTPETDKNTWSDSSDGVLYNVVTADFARRMERERDEAREKIKRQAERIRKLEGATNHACGTPLAIAIRERDEALLKIERLKIERDQALNRLQEGGK